MPKTNLIVEGSFRALPPTIIVTPTNQTVLSGDLATVSVLATGAGPFTYEWYVNGGEVRGTNATFSYRPYPYTTFITVYVRNQVGVTGGEAQIQAKTRLVENDDFINARLLEGYGNQFFITQSDATSFEVGEPNDDGNTGSEWFKWVAPATGETLLEFVDASHGSVLAVYTGETLANLKLVAKAIRSDTTRQIMLKAVAGTRYNISFQNRTISSGGRLSLVVQEIHINSIVLNNSERRIILSGPEAWNFIIENSTNLVDWQLSFKGRIPRPGITGYAFPMSFAPSRFYRAAIVEE